MTADIKQIILQITNVQLFIHSEDIHVESTPSLKLPSYCGLEMRVLLLGHVTSPAQGA